MAVSFSFSLSVTPVPRNKDSEDFDDLKNIIDSIYILARHVSVSKGTTAQRPQLTTEDIGILYFDTTLAVNGKPIWWNGTNWVDYSGTII